MPRTRGAHRELKKVSCPHCGRKFCSTTNMLQHMNQPLGPCLGKLLFDSLVSDFKSEAPPTQLPDGSFTPDDKLEDTAFDFSELQCDCHNDDDIQMDDLPARCRAQSLPSLADAHTMPFHHPHTSFLPLLQILCYLLLYPCIHTPGSYHPYLGLARKPHFVLDPHPHHPGFVGKSSFSLLSHVTSSLLSSSYVHSMFLSTYAHMDS